MEKRIWVLGREILLFVRRGLEQLVAVEKGASVVCLKVALNVAWEGP